jgi:hypothetical protein
VRVTLFSVLDFSRRVTVRAIRWTFINVTANLIQRHGHYVWCCPRWISNLSSSVCFWITFRRSKNAAGARIVPNPQRSAKPMSVGKPRPHRTWADTPWSADSKRKRPDTTPASQQHFFKLFAGVTTPNANENTKSPVFRMSPVLGTKDKFPSHPPCHPQTMVFVQRCYPSAVKNAGFLRVSVVKWFYCQNSFKFIKFAQK